MQSSEKLQYPPFYVVSLCSCDKVNDKQEVCFILYLLGQIVALQYNPNLLDENRPCPVINHHDWQFGNCQL